LRSLYVLNTMEPAPVDKAIADEEARVKRAAEEAAKNRGRMSILSDGRQIVKPNKEEAKKLAKQMDADLKKVLAASSSPQDKKKRLESLKTSYESKGMGTAPIDKEIKKLDQQLAKSKAKPAAKKSSSRKR
jgi:alkanesulfonate monooxygenase SsuD/methylene tetrahydromethanopterin reductase-like flavin-dependent oxidoreductase (luciferase family)